MCKTQNIIVNAFQNYSSYLLTFNVVFKVLPRPLSPPPPSAAGAELSQTINCYRAFSMPQITNLPVLGPPLSSSVVAPPFAAVVVPPPPPPQLLVETPGVLALAGALDLLVLPVPPPPVPPSVVPPPHLGDLLNFLLLVYTFSVVFLDFFLGGPLDPPPVVPSPPPPPPFFAVPSSSVVRRVVAVVPLPLRRQPEGLLQISNDDEAAGGVCVVAAVAVVAAAAVAPGVGGPFVFGREDPLLRWGAAVLGGK